MRFSSRPQEDAAAAWAILCAYALDRGDEARELMRTLSLP
jgi:hypothetical protein